MCCFMMRGRGLGAGVSAGMGRAAGFGAINDAETCPVSIITALLSGWLHANYARAHTCPCDCEPTCSRVVSLGSLHTSISVASALADKSLYMSLLHV